MVVLEVSSVTDIESRLAAVSSDVGDGTVFAESVVAVLSILVAVFDNGISLSALSDFLVDAELLERSGLATTDVEVSVELTE